MLQYGGTAGQDGTYRVFGHYFQDVGSQTVNGLAGSDDWHGSHGGFRSDWDLSSEDQVTVQGDYFGTSEAEPITTLISTELPSLYSFNDKAVSEAENILTRWNHAFADGSEASLQLYYDRDYRRDLGTAESLNTGDFDFQYHFHAGSRNDVVTGGGYRISELDFTAGYALGFSVDHRCDNLLNAFIQDEIQISKTITLTVGSKFEHNSYTGFEYEPSAQFVWAPSKHQTLWASVSRAIRQPALYDFYLNEEAATVPLPSGGFGVVQILGGKTVAETLLDFETGYRADLSKRVSAELTLFASRYHDLETSEPGTSYFSFTPGPPHLVIPYYLANLAYANDYGMEFFARWNATKRWTISPGYSYLDMNMKFDPSSKDIFDRGYTGISPKHQFQARSTLSLRHHLEWDASLYYVSELRTGPVPAYARVDTRVGWHAGESWDFSVSGQNLLSPRHVEYWNPFSGLIPTYAQRSVLGKVTYRF